MKKTLLGQHLILFIVMTVLIIMLGVVNYFGYGKWMENYFSIAAVPVLKSSNNFFSGINGIWEKFYKTDEIYKENQKLREQNMNLEAEMSKLREVNKENEMLRQLLQFDKQKEFVLKESNVIGKNTDNLGRYLIVDKGKGNGIKVGDAVIVANGILAGKIAEVSSGFSKVKLIISSDSAVAALVQETRTAGVVKGQYNLSLIMDMINPNDTIDANNYIITSGQDNEFPKGLLIGKVKEVKSVPGNIFKTATLDSALNFEKLETVYVLSKQ